MILTHAILRPRLGNCKHVPASRTLKSSRQFGLRQAETGTGEEDGAGLRDRGVFVRGAVAFGIRGRQFGFRLSVSTLDFMASVCRVLGIDYNKQVQTPIGRPIRIVERGANPINGLV